LCQTGSLNRIGVSHSDGNEGFYLLGKTSPDGLRTTVYSDNKSAIGPHIANVFLGEWGDNSRSSNVLQVEWEIKHIVTRKHVGSGSIRNKILKEAS
jgi:hypothetical protein